MKTIQPTLINFSAFSNLNLLSGDVIITKSGIIHTKRAECGYCGRTCHYNGSSNTGKHILSRSNECFFRKGQQYCPTCERTIQVENEWIDNMLLSINQFVASQIISLSEQLSEDEIISHLETTMSIKISKSTVHNVITQSNQKFEEIEFEYEVKEGFYGYDEQFLKIDGKRAYRIVFYDLTENKVIYERIHYKFSKKILQKILTEVFPNTKPKGFVTDMRVEYPSAFRSVFGRKVKLQFCIFHLNKLILKEYAEALKFGKSVKWTLVEKYNLYSLFNIYYNRSFELKRLKKLMWHLENFKMKLTEDKVASYVDKYKITLKTYELQKRDVIKIMENKLLKSFRKMLHDKRNLRKRRRGTLQVRSIESATQIFEKIKQEKQIFPQKIQKRIARIEKNFEFFIASEGEVLTNNKLEGFFGATLKKFRKKSRKSLLSFSALLKRKRARQKGIDFYRKFTIFDMAKIFTACAFFAH
jgi:hypothetical protein